VGLTMGSLVGAYDGSYVGSNEGVPVVGSEVG